MTLELLSNRKMMLAKEILPSAIPDLRGLFGRVHNVREQHGGKNPVWLGSAARPSQEGLHLVTNGIHVPRPWHVIIPGKLHIVCPGDVFGKVAAVLDLDGSISNAMEHKCGDGDSWQHMPHVDFLIHVDCGQRRAGTGCGALVTPGPAHVILIPGKAWRIHFNGETFSPVLLDKPQPSG